MRKLNTKFFVILVVTLALLTGAVFGVHRLQANSIADQTVGNRRIDVRRVVFVDAARRYLESLPDDASGWLAALRDRHVGRAIHLMHERPADPWTIGCFTSRIRKIAI